MKTVCVIMFLLSSLICSAGDSTSLLREAEVAYRDSDYVKAVGLYQNVLSRDGANAEIYYNLGNAYACLENYGPAVLNYRKALKLSPLNGNARHNLAYVEQKVSVANETMVEDKNLDPTPGAMSLFSNIRTHAEAPGSNFWAWTSGVLFLLFCISAAVYLFVRRPMWKKVGFFSSFLAFVMSLGCYGLSYSARSSTLKTTDCVLLTPSSSLREEPSQKAKEVAAPLSGGTVFRVLDKKTDKSGDGWVKVWLNDDFTGWIPSADVDMITI